MQINQLHNYNFSLTGATLNRTDTCVVINTQQLANHEESGVYLFTVADAHIDGQVHVLYVGKAQGLRSRLAQHGVAQQGVDAEAGERTPLYRGMEALGAVDGQVWFRPAVALAANVLGLPGGQVCAYSAEEEAMIAYCLRNGEPLVNRMRPPVPNEERDRFPVLEWLNTQVRNNSRAEHVKMWIDAYDSWDDRIRAAVERALAELITIADQPERAGRLVGRYAGGLLRHRPVVVLGTLGEGGRLLPNTRWLIFDFRRLVILTHPGNAALQSLTVVIDPLEF